MDHLEIPPDIEGTLLPSETTPVASLSTFHIPGQQNSNIPTLVHPALSEQLPSAGIDQLLYHATPSVEDVARLRELFLCPGCSARSVLVPRPGRHEDPPRYAPWAITYWLRLSVVRQAKREWADAMQHLQKMNYKRVEKQTKETSILVDRVLDVLHTLPWAGAIEGFSVQFPCTCLATYLSTKWLSSEHEDHMLSLLRHDLLISGHHTSITIEDTTFTQKLHDAYAHRSDTYTLSSSHN
ncbi:hypothetical protein BDZ89DRAFT_1139562 [Hymenopellis radicata]|nr:hypothetical protein BDZ89DRAFT_1139562 [Hymenopellis radicata]